MSDALKENRILRSLLWLAGAWAVGLGVARYLAPPQYAGRTMVGAVVFGALLAGVVYRPRTQRASGAAPRALPLAAPRVGRLTTRRERAPRSSGSDLFLVVDAVSDARGGGQGASGSTLLSRIAAEEGTDAFFVRSDDGSAGGPTTWTLRSRGERVADFVETSFAMHDADAAKTRLRSLLGDLRLAGRWVDTTTLLRHLFTGHVPSNVHRLRGVIVCIPLKEFRDDRESTGVLSVLRSIGQTTRTNFPVYLVLTGLEALPGFAETAAALGQASDGVLATPAGCFFAQHPDVDASRRAIRSVVDGFAGRLPALLCRQPDPSSGADRLDPHVQAALLAQLSEQRWSLLEFVSRLESSVGGLTSRLHALVVKASSERYEPRLRGVFLSGLAPAGARGWDELDRSRTHVEQFHQTFVEQLLTTYLPSEPRLTTRTLSAAARRRWLGVYRVTAALAGVVAVLVGISAYRNWYTVRDAADVVRRVAAIDVTVGAAEMERALDALDTLEGRRTILAGRTAWYERLGLYQGDRVRAALDTAYTTALRERLLRPVVASLESRLAAAPLLVDGTPEISLQETIRLYRMLYRQPECPLDQSFLADRSAAIWAASTQGENRGRLAAGALPHFSRAARALARNDRSLVARRPRNDLVEGARSHLARSRGFADVFAEILQRANLTETTLDDVVHDTPERAPQLARDVKATLSGAASVKSAFTPTAWPNVITQLASWRDHVGADACVAPLGPSEAPAAEEKDPYATYAAAYIEAWQGLLGGARGGTTGLRVNDDFSAGSASGQLRILYGERSPLLAALAWVSENTRPPEIGPPQAVAAARAVARALQPVHMVAAPGTDRWSGGWWNTGYRAHLVNLQVAMQEVASRPSDRASRARARERSLEAISVIEGERFPTGADGVADAVKRLLRTPFQRVLQLTDEDPSAETNGMLAGFCRDLGRLQSKDDITLEEFNRVFDPEVGSFYRFQRANVVRRDGPGGPWVPGQAVDGLTLDDQFLTFLGQVGQVTNRLYAGQPFGAEVTLEVRPFDRGTEISIGDQRATRIGGSGSAAILKARWPGPNPAAGFFIKTRGGGLHYPGFWGLYRMIASADQRRPAQSEIVLQQPREGNGVLSSPVSIAFQNLPGGLDGPLAGLRCPRRAGSR